LRFDFYPEREALNLQFIPAIGKKWVGGNTSKALEIFLINLSRYAFFFITLQFEMPPESFPPIIEQFMTANKTLIDF